MPFTNPWTETEPTDNTYVRETDNWLRRIAIAFRERLGIDHYTYSDETGKTLVGKHKVGTARGSVTTTAQKPANDSATPGGLNYDTERKVLSVDTGAAWTQAAPPVLHVAQHKTGGADALALADIGAASATDVSTLTTNYNAHAASNQKHVPSATYVAKTSRTDQSVGWDDVVSKPTTFTPAEHTHDTIDAASVNGFTITSESSDHIASGSGDTYDINGSLYSISGDVTTEIQNGILTVTAGEDQTGEYTITFINITKV